MHRCMSSMSTRRWTTASGCCRAICARVPLPPYHPRHHLACCRTSATTPLCVLRYESQFVKTRASIRGIKKARSFIFRKRDDGAAVFWSPPSSPPTLQCIHSRARAPTHSPSHHKWHCCAAQVQAGRGTQNVVPRREGCRRRASWRDCDRHGNRRGNYRVHEGPQRYRGDIPPTAGLSVAAFTPSARECSYLPCRCSALKTGPQAAAQISRPRSLASARREASGRTSISKKRSKLSTALCKCASPSYPPL